MKIFACLKICKLNLLSTSYGRCFGDCFTQLAIKALRTMTKAMGLTSDGLLGLLLCFTTVDCSLSHSWLTHTCVVIQRSELGTLSQLCLLRVKGQSVQKLRYWRASCKGLQRLKIRHLTLEAWELNLGINWSPRARNGWEIRCENTVQDTEDEIWKETRSHTNLELNKILGDITNM